MFESLLTRGRRTNHMKTGVIDFGISDEVLLWKTYRKVRPDFIDLEDSHT